MGDTDCTSPSARASTGTSTGLPARSVGNPINVTNGNKYERAADLAELPGTLPVYFVRHYNSRIRSKGPLGYGWRHSYQLSLRVSPSGLSLLQADGRLLHFETGTPDAQGNPRYQGRLAADGEIIADNIGYLWHQPGGKRLRFSREGVLQEIRWLGERLQLHYDRDGRLQRVVDSQERRLGFVYDKRDRLSAIIDPTGQKTRYHYDARNNLDRVTGPDGGQRYYHYEDPHDRHNLTGITDERGVRFATWRYDEQDRAIYSSHAEQVGEIHLDFSTPGQTRVTDSQSRISTYLIESDQGISRVQAIQGPGCASCGGGDISFRYNDRHQLIERTTRDGLSQHFHYDAQGRTAVVARTRPGEAPQPLLRYEYEGESQRPASLIRPSVNPQGEHRFDIRYNAEKQPTQLTEQGWRPEPDGGYSPLERTTRLSYDPNGNLTQIDGPRDDVQDITRLSYDSSQRLRELQTPDGRSQRVLAYDEAGRPLKLQSSGQLPLSLAYDERGNLTRVSQGNKSIRYEYDPSDRLIAVTGADGKRTQIDYDAAGRATALQGPTGRRLELELDRQDRLTRRSFSDSADNLLATVSYLYDAQGRLNTRREADGDTRYHYQDGQLQAIEDPAGNRTELAYNGLGQLLAITQPESRVTRLAYDNAGQAIALTDPRDNTTRLPRDDFGNLVSRSHPDTGTTHYRHDNAGNLIAKIDPDGRSTDYRYNAANRLIEERTPDTTTRLDYDPETGRLASLQDDLSRETFSYNRAGQLIAHTRELDGNIFTTAYAYNDAGDLSQKTLPDGQPLHYHYYLEGKNKGQLRAITRPGLLGLTQTPLIGEIDHDASDGETGLTYGNGLRETRRHDALGRTTAIRHERQLQLQYHYDPYGRISAIDLNGMLQRYGYDQWGRLSQAETQLGDYRYRYDSLGNRTEKQHTAPDGEKIRETADYPEAGQGNRLLSQSSGAQANYRYNTAGSPEQIGQRRYVYNAQQRPIQVYQQQEDGSETLLAEYAYNRFGERIKKVVYSNSKRPKVTYYLYDGHQLTAEADEQGRITAQYLYLDERPVTKLEGDTAYALHTDHLGAPRAVTDEDQQLVWQADYSPFGLIDIQTQQITLNLRLPGQYADQETGTYYNYHRDYDPITGRYLTSDPIGIDGGINLYGYTKNNPLIFVDALGLAPGGANYADIPISPDSWNDGFGGIQLMTVVAPHLPKSGVVSLPPKPAVGRYQYVPEVEIVDGSPQVLYYTAYDPMNGQFDWAIAPEQLSFFMDNEEFAYNYAAAMTPRSGSELYAARMGYDIMIRDFEGAVNNICLSWTEAVTESDWWLETFLGFAGGVVSKEASAFSRIPPRGSIFERGAVADGRFVQVKARPTKSFSDDGVKIYSARAGKEINTVQDLTDAIRAGEVSLRDVPVDFVDIGGVRYILNTRTSTALENAGIPKSQWYGRNQTDKVAYVDRGSGRDVTYNELAMDQLENNIDVVGPSGSATLIER